MKINKKFLSIDTHLFTEIQFFFGAFFLIGGIDKCIFLFFWIIRWWGGPDMYKLIELSWELFWVVAALGAEWHVEAWLGPRKHISEDSIIYI
jgi:hypothetical protein